MGQHPNSPSSHASLVPSERSVRCMKVDGNPDVAANAMDDQD
ncbi:hypothetical protein Hsar01_00428 [Haloferula sargassicola]|uniref:Uncharacterized protein n=1 Tax=Haloferula sargassicola TaxID=490096 RepID=A0ABP9UKJ1_9BACT